MCLVTKCGTFTVKVSTAASDTHTAGTETSPTLTVNKANDTATAPTAKTVTYYGSAQELVNVGSTNDGTLYCAVTTENKAPTDEKLYTTSIPSKIDAGTYYVWYKVDGDANHNDYGPYPVTVSILKEKVTPEKPTGESLVYSGKEQLLVKAGSVEGGTLVYAVGKNGKTAPTEGWSKAVPSGKDAGTYYVWYKVQGDKNHNDTDPAALEAKIARKSLVVTPADKSKTYGEDAQAHGEAHRQADKDAQAHGEAQPSSRRGRPGPPRRPSLPPTRISRCWRG